MMTEPSPPRFERFRFFLIRAGRIQHVVIVNVIDGGQIRFGGRADVV